MPISHASSSIEVALFPCLKDNYGFLLHDSASGQTASIDTPEADPILAALKQQGWQLTHILNTHHHWDHTGGNLELKKATGCTVIGPHSEAGRIPGLDTAVADGDVIEFGGHRIEVLETSGHTSGHVVYYLPEEKLAFVGDTLFAMGCGRLFEGSAEQMWHSLQKIMAWPDDTRLYCAHEYTEANASFALTVEPENTELQQRAKEVRGLRAENQPTIPTTLIREKATNPFLRVDSPAIRSRLEMKNARPEEVFARIRALKDNF